MDISDLLAQLPVILMLVAVGMATYLRYITSRQRTRYRTERAATGKENKTLRKRTRELELSVQGLQLDKDTLTGRATGCEQERTDLQRRVRQLTSERNDLRYERNSALTALYAADAAYEQRYLDRQRQAWFAHVRRLHANHSFRRRADIGVNVFYPLLRFLGYPQDAFDVDHALPQRGRPQAKLVHVSCYVFEMLGGGQARPLFVLQAVEPDTGINELVRDEVDMNAYAVGATSYVLVDGEYFELYRVGPDKSPSVRCRLSELGGAWDDIYAALACRPSPRTPAAP